LNSPSMQLLKWVQSEFPTLHPGGVTDSKPLMSPIMPQFEPGNEKLNLARARVSDI
jgi:nitrous oxidase accessory protein